LRLRAERFGDRESSQELRFEIYSTDGCGSLNKSLKFWAAGDFCRKIVFVYRLDKKAEGRILYGKKIVF
jgi:hypothetical protein